MLGISKIANYNSSWIVDLSKTMVLQTMYHLWGLGFEQQNSKTKWHKKEIARISNNKNAKLSKFTEEY